MSVTADRLARLTPEQRALYEQMSREKSGLRASVIGRRPPGSPPRASFAQERLWLMDRLAGGTALHTVGLHFRLQGPLDHATLDRAFVEVARRHEALRTTLDTVDGAPVPVLLPAPAEVLEVVDLRALPPADREAEAARIAAGEARRPFDLRRDRPLRAKLVAVGADAHVLLISAHHAAFDGWSAGVLIRELSALYEAFSRDLPSPFPELGLQYADYAAWQRGRVEGALLASDLAHWRARLAGASRLDLPLDRPRPVVPSQRSVIARAEAPRAIVAAIDALCRAEGVTAFMAILAAFQLLLQRFSGQDDIVVGTPVAGRSRSELEGLVGVFINTLALRADLSRDPSFRALLAETRAAVAEGFAHQDLPFERLASELAAGRRAGAPIFQALLVVDAAEPPLPSLGGARATALPVDHGLIDVDLALNVSRGQSGFSCALRGDADLFDEATLSRMLGCFLALLGAAAADPARPASRLDVLPAAAREEILFAWNRTEADFPRDLRVHDLFAAQAERAPDAIAVVFEGEAITYKNVATRASRLARRLAAEGAGPGARVGVLVERSPDLIVALLGVLQAGAAYVPLDPDHPEARLAFMLEDARASLVLTDRTLAARVPAGGPRVVLLDGAAVADEGASDGIDRARAEDAAYVIYTSGSTGRPKGVPITHRSFVNFLTDMVVKPGLGERDALLAVTTISFDIAGLEIFLPLSVGARVVIADRRTAADGAALRALLSRSAATVLQATPATWRLLVGAGFEGGPGFTAISGGDALPPDLAAELLRRAGAVYNLYGPTETTIWSTLHRVIDAGAPVSIGRPIANTRAYVLDRHMQPVPVGVAGELCLGGDGVSAGYLDRPDLTADRFVPDPFVPGARVYRTGDRARLRADGALVHLGRLDFQVKIRGHRVEPGEIEAALVAHPSIREAAVVARADAAGDAHLAAFVAARGDPPALAAIRAHLAASLPGAMIPTEIVVLDALPLTSNGKVDRGALAASQAPRVVITDASVAAFAAPADALEAELVALWQEILEVSPVSTRADFFELGGHSMRAARLVDRIEACVGRRLPIATLIEAPTITALAALLRREGWSPSWTSLVTIRAAGSKPPFFCVHALGGNVLSYRLLADRIDADRPFYGLQSRGLDGVTAPHASVEEMAAAYIDELRAVQPRGPYHVGGSSSGGVIAYEIAQQLVARGDDVALLLLLDTYRFDRAAASAPRSRRSSTDEILGKFRVARDPRVTALQVIGRARQRAARHLGDLAGVAGLARRGQPTALDVVHQRNSEAVLAYAPRPYPGRITALLSRGQADRTFEDRRLEWASLAGRGFEIQFIPGDHDTMLDEDNVAGVAEVVDTCLRRSDP